MKTLTKDARGFVDGVIKYIKSDGKSPTAGTKVRAMLSRVSDLDKNQNRAIVETAIELDKKEKDQFTKLVERLAGRQVDIAWTVNAQLLGGCKIIIGDYVLDDSLLNQLSHIQSVLF
jgi:F0F1-type ATP synthase delta subunit